MEYYAAVIMLPPKLSLPQANFLKDGNGTDTLRSLVLRRLGQEGRASGRFLLAEGLCPPYGEEAGSVPLRDVLEVEQLERSKGPGLLNCAPFSLVCFWRMLGQGSPVSTLARHTDGSYHVLTGFLILHVAPRSAGFSAASFCR